jgi:hypothetical protein
MATGYLLMAKLATVRMRDVPRNQAPSNDHPIYELERDKWTPFRHLPSSLEPRYEHEEPTGDKEIAVKVVDNIEEYPAPEALNAPKPKPEPEPEPVEETPPAPAKLSQTVSAEEFERVMAEPSKAEKAKAAKAAKAENAKAAKDAKKVRGK